MELDLENVLEVMEIRKLISHKKKLLEFFDELLKIKNSMINDSSDYESSDCSSEKNFSDYESDYDYDSSSED